MGVKGIVLGEVAARYPTKMDVLNAAREKRNDKTVTVFHELLSASLGAPVLPDTIFSGIQSQLIE